MPDCSQTPANRQRSDQAQDRFLEAIEQVSAHLSQLEETPHAAVVSYTGEPGSGVDEVGLKVVRRFVVTLCFGTIEPEWSHDEN